MTTTATPSGPPAPPTTNGANGPTASTDTRSLAHELRAAGVVWQRELIRFVRARARIVSGLLQPLLFLFVLGGGLAPLVGATDGFDFRQFVFPGVIAMSVLTTAIFSAVSIVWDREFGFLREMLVAPVSRTALVVGKALGGATVATLQGALMLFLAPAIGVRLTLPAILGVLGAAVLMAFSLTSLGIVVATRIQRMESFQIVMQVLLMPMLFLSGALFPLANLPGWLTVLTRLNPVTYAVDPLRRAVLSVQDLSPAVIEQFGAGVTLFGRVLPVAVEVGIVAGVSLVFLAFGIRGFNRKD